MLQEGQQMGIPAPETGGGRDGRAGGWGGVHGLGGEAGRQLQEGQQLCIPDTTGGDKDANVGGGRREAACAVREGKGAGWRQRRGSSCAFRV